MPIFSYTTKKLLKSKINWIVLTLTILGLWLFYYLTYYYNSQSLEKDLKEINDKKINADLFLLYTHYLWTGWNVGVLVILISIFLFIFVAVNTSKILREEIEDGTLLILVSKPISRQRIWVEKILSFQSIIIGYVFFSLFISSFIIFIPIFGGVWAFFAFIPFMFISFGIIIIIELVITSISYLISLFTRGIIVASIIIGVGFVFVISNQVIDKLVSAPLELTNYSKIARASYVMKKINQSVSKTTMTRILTNYIKMDPLSFIDNVDNLFLTLYENYIFVGEKKYIYPNAYSSMGEQNIFKEIAGGNIGKYPELQNYKELIIDIYNIGEALITNKNMSYAQMLYGKKELKNITGEVIYNAINGNNYNLINVFSNIKQTISGSDYEVYQQNLKRLVILRYVNVFYHLSYIWDGFFNNNYQFNLLSTINVFEPLNPWIKDPYLIELQYNKDANNYWIDIDKYGFNASSEKVLNWTIVTSIYGLIGLVLFATSLYLFLKKDFT